MVKVGPTTGTVSPTSRTLGVPKPASSPHLIIGSRLPPGAPVDHFRWRWQCLGSLEHGEWRRNDTPRVIPWARDALRMGAFQARMERQFDVPQANKDVLAGKFLNASDTWRAPDVVRYDWAVREGPKGPPCGRPTPSFASLDGGAFCSALRRATNGGSFFVVGDSISSTFMAALLAELDTAGVPIELLDPTPECARFRENLPKRDKRYRSRWLFRPCYRWRVCGGGPSDPNAVVMHYTISCHLQYVHGGVPRASYGRGTWCKQMYDFFFGEEMVRQNASVVLLNRGAHFVPQAAYAEQLRFSLSELRRMLPNALVLFRSSMPGHPNCQQYTQPLKRPLNISGAPYNWPKIEDENPLARDLVREVGGAFLNVAPMTSLRPDGHITGNDCLHYEVPGPPNAWVKFFAAMLQEMV